MALLHSPSDVHLDEQDCLSLEQILQQFQSPLSEEQGWSLAFQTFLCFKNHFDRHSTLLVTKLDHLFIQQDGTVHPKTLTQDSHKNREMARSPQRLLAHFGLLLYSALDFGLRDDEERRLSRPLEALIESLTNCCEEDDEGFSDVTEFDGIEKCLKRVKTSSEPEMHYKNVLRVLILETLELKSFLSKVSKIKEENQSHPEPDPDWAKMWIQVVRELRNGARLKHVLVENEARAEYALTPFEMLLQDIKERNYRLNHVPQEQAFRHKKDAHQLILDFIRSRPTLTPAAERSLRPLPEKEFSLYEKLMQSIRRKEVILKPVSTRCNSLNTLNTSSSPSSRTTMVPEARSLTPAPQRRLIKANLNLDLNHSFDDSDDTDDTHDDTRDDGRRRFSLRNLSLRLVSSEKRSLEPIALDVNEDARNHVATIWEKSDFGRKLQCLSLTLQEVQHIRSVLTKAEMETLAVTKELQEDLQSQRICFTCLKTRFSFFGARANTCKVCERAICDRCASRMHIPEESFDKVPIYMLSPSPSPPEAPPTLPSSRPQMEPPRSALNKWIRRDVVLVDSGLRRSGPLVRVCRDCKRLVRHLVDTGSAFH